MKYYKILIGDNEIIINEQYSAANNVITVGECMYFSLKEDEETKDSWVEITETEWNEIQPTNIDMREEVTTQLDRIEANLDYIVMMSE